MEVAQQVGHLLHQLVQVQALDAGLALARRRPASAGSRSGALGHEPPRGSPGSGRAGSRGPPSGPVPRCPAWPPSRLLKSWAMPPARTPRDSSFWVWSRAWSACLRSVMSVAMMPQAPALARGVHQRELVGKVMVGRCPRRRDPLLRLEVLPGRAGPAGPWPRSARAVSGGNSLRVGPAEDLPGGPADEGLHPRVDEQETPVQRP